MSELKEIYLRRGFVAQDYIDISSEIFVEINNYFKIVDCNLNFCKLYNLPRTQIFGSEITDVINEPDKIKFLDIIRRIQRRKFKDGLIKIELVDYKKRVSVYAMKYNPVVDDNNVIRGVFLKFSNFVKRTEDSEVNTLFLSIYNSLTNLYTIYATDTKLRINHVNSSLTNILGYTKEEMLTKEIIEFLVKNKKTEDNIKKLFLSLDNNGKFAGEVLYKAKNGEEIPIYLAVSSLIHNGKVIGSLGIGRDMRDEKKLEAENQAFALKLQSHSKLAEFGMMLQGVAHNMNTPLTGIKSRAQLEHAKLAKFKKMINEKYGHEEDLGKVTDSISKFLSMIDQSVSKLAKIIKNMMAKSRDQQSLVKEGLNLANVMEQELEFIMSNQFFKHKVEKVIKIQSDLPLVYGLYSDFSQSFVNIIKNAIDSMYDTPEKVLTVKLYQHEDNIVVKIKDTGKGIPKEVGDKIFQPFFTTKPKIGQSVGEEPTGTGIGLDSVISLLKPYKAKISYESEVGKGTQFTIIIPISVNKNK
ncbi:MAG: PAS domain-containing sensor histidine kinase [Candidatus Delongbacteria bacterium]|nr:PAS domain-containing sensor histidine kinase [Candidatus Delongbacteria bacterium]